MLPARWFDGLSSKPRPVMVVLQAGAEGAKAVLIAGAPLNEPIAQYGPFVMNTRDEIEQALADYRAGTLAG